MRSQLGLGSCPMGAAAARVRQGGMLAPGCLDRREVCEACGFPTRQGEEARYAAQKRQLLSTAGGGLGARGAADFVWVRTPAGRTAVSPGLRQGRRMHGGQVGPFAAS